MGESNTQAARLREVSRRRREQQKDDLRRTILDAAAGLFVEHGYEALSMRQIAERIGYSATTIYRYYEDKDDLLFAIVQEGFQRFGTQLTKAARRGGGEPLARLQALGHAYVEFGLRNPVYYQLMFMQRSDFLFESRAEEAPMIDSFGVLQQSVEQAMEAGILRRGDPVTTSTVIWAVMHGITSLAIADAKRFTRRQVQQSTELAMQMIRDGLRQT